MRLSGTQLSLLILISERGSVTAAEAGALLHLSLPTVTPAAAQLVRRELLASSQGRPRRLFLTELGSRALATCFDWVARLEAAARGLAPHEQRLLTSAIPTLLNAMTVESTSIEVRGSAQSSDAQDTKI
jgi:DNA-binding MarR family transcriptional regulator